MYRLLIVDDEHHIVNWLSYIFENIPDMDLEINKAYTGMDALNLMEKTKMDIIMLDIQMPGLNGLLIGEKISLAWPMAYIVFLTGYNEFNYIYQASRLRHVSYLLKSEDDECIIQEVRNCIAKIEHDKKMFQLNKQASAHNLLLKHLFQTDFLKDIMNGLSPAEIWHSVKKYKIDLTIDLNKPVWLCYIKISEGIENRQTFSYTSFRQELPILIDYILKPEDHFAILPGGAHLFLWMIQPGISTNDVTLSEEDYLKCITEELLSTCQTQLQCTCSLLLYLEELKWEDVYKTALLLQEYSTLKLPQALNGNSFRTTLYRHQLNELQKPETIMVPASAKLLLSELESKLLQCDKSGYFEILGNLCSQLCAEKSMHNLHALEIYMRISTILIGYINQFQLQEKMALKINLYSLYYISNFSSWSESANYLNSISNILFSEISSLETDRRFELVNRLKKFISKHLSDELSLNLLAEHFNYNSSYISHLFKQTAGIGISEYITDLRLEKANELLCHTNESISAIAEMTGFDTAQYFSYVYKKRNGITPSEYRSISN